MLPKYNSERYRRAETTYRTTIAAHCPLLARRLQRRKRRLFLCRSSSSRYGRGTTFYSD